MRTREAIENLQLISQLKNNCLESFTHFFENVFNARQLFRPFGDSSVASKIHVLTFALVCAEFPAHQLGKNVDRLLRF